MSRFPASIFAISLASFARASGPNIQLAIVNNQVVTTHYFPNANSSYALAGATYIGENYNPLYVDQSMRMFDVPLVFNSSSGATFGIPDSGWYGQMIDDGSAPFTGPGIAYGANADLAGNPAQSGFSAGSMIAEYLVGSLKVWNGSAFVVCQSDRLEGIAGPMDTDSSQPFFSDPILTETGSWGVTPATIGPDDNAQVEWRFDYANSEIPDPSPADGIYLMELQVGTNEKINGITVAASLPFYFVFNKNDSDDADAADAYVQNILLPEPSVTLCLIPFSVALRSLRRRKS